MEDCVGVLRSKAESRGVEGIRLHLLTLNRPGFLQIGMARGGAYSAPLCNFCLDGPIDLKFGM